MTRALPPSSVVPAAGLIRVLDLAGYLPVPEVAQVLRAQGVDPARARPALSAAAERALAAGAPLLAPAAACAILAIRSVQEDDVVLAVGTVLHGPAIARAAQDCSHLALALFTIGPGIEEEYARVQAADPLLGMGLDGMATAAVRTLSAWVAQRVGEMAAGLRLAPATRVFPGAKGWDLEQQAPLFQVLPAGQLGIRLTPSFLMLPRKSGTFALGLKPIEEGQGEQPAHT